MKGLSKGFFAKKRFDHPDWQEVARPIEKDERTKAQQEARRLAISPTPYLDDITKAATRLGYDYSLVRYQILAYAEKNKFCHSGIKGMIDHAESAAHNLISSVAKCIFDDVRQCALLLHLFARNPHMQRYGGSVDLADGEAAAGVNRPQGRENLRSSARSILLQHDSTIVL